MRAPRNPPRCFRRSRHDKMQIACIEAPLRVGPGGGHAYGGPLLFNTRTRKLIVGPLNVTPDPPEQSLLFRWVWGHFQPPNDKFPLLQNRFGVSGDALDRHWDPCPPPGRRPAVANQARTEALCGPPPGHAARFRSQLALAPPRRREGPLRQVVHHRYALQGGRRTPWRGRADCEAPLGSVVAARRDLEKKGSKNKQHVDMIASLIVPDM